MTQSGRILCCGLHFVLVFGFLLCFLQPATSLECRICDNAHSLDQCHEFLVCRPDEICYTDEKVTTSGLVFSAGCRAADVCASASSGTHVGRRAGEDSVVRRSSDVLIACSRCCHTDRDNASYECNTKLCGLLGTASAALNLCYDCEVYNMDNCRTTTLCQRNEVCYSETFLHSGQPPHYRLGCTGTHSCIGQTKVILQLMKKYANVGRRGISLESQQGSSEAAEQRTSVVSQQGTSEAAQQQGTREKDAARRSGDVQACNTCCADPLCNTNDCTILAEKLFALDNNHHLDLNTMKVIRP